MSYRFACARSVSILAACGALALAQAVRAAITVTTPYQGVTYITRTETLPRAETMHIAEIDLTAPGISFGVTPASGAKETTRQTTTDFVAQSNAQLGINIAFFDPVTVPASSNPQVYLAGMIASSGQVVSKFDPQPAPGFAPNQSYAIVSYAPALNISASNQAMIVHRDPSQADNQHILENTTLWNAVSGSAQIITDGTVTIPQYNDATHPDGLLTPGGPASYTNTHSWYDLINARTAIGITQDGKTLVLFTVDLAGGSQGMSVGEVANVLKNDYGCYEALNLDGGGSTAMSLRNPGTGIVSEVNASSDGNYVGGRPEGVNLAVFAAPVPEPVSVGVLGIGVIALLARRARRMRG